MIYKTLFTIFLLLSVICSTAEANSPDIQIISDNDEGITLEFTLPPFDLETVVETDSPCQRIVMPSGWSTTLEPGYPEIPTTGVLIEVPSSGDIATAILERSEAILSQIELCPVPEQNVSKNGTVTFQFLRNDDAYQTEGFYPQSVLKLDSRAILRGIDVNRLLISPFQWNPLTRELRYFNRIRLQVQFDNSSSTPQGAVRARSDKSDSVGNVYETFLERTILNYRSQPAVPTPLLSRSSKSLRQSGNVEQTDSVRKSQPYDALRIEIVEEGIYRISYEELDAAGLPMAFIQPDKLQLFNLEKEVAIKIVAEEPDHLKPGDYIEFYAQGVDNVFTDTNVYWLYWRKKGFGQRLAQIEGQVTGGGEKLDVFYETLHIENNAQFWLGTPGAPEADYWFWQRLNASDVGEYTFDLFSPSSEPMEALIRVGYQGRSTALPSPNHHTIVKLNDTVIGDERWDGDSKYTQEMRFSSELFTEGRNTLKVEMPGDTGAIVDVIYQDWIEVEYWRKLEAVKDNLVFNVGGSSKIEVEVKKLTQPDIVIYDITDPNQVAEVINFSVEGDNKDYQTTFEAPAGENQTYYVATTQQIKSPLTLAPWKSAQLSSQKNGADYIIITAQEFLPAVEPLTQLRRRQGLRVKAVSVEEIYNEFSGGLFHPGAIKAFLKQAYDTWSRPAPTYVFLVGEGHINYRDTKKTTKENIVPIHFSSSAEGLNPDDSWYVSVDGEDILPDMFIGRIPVGTLEKVTELVDKIVRFENSTLDNPRKVLLVADSDDQFEMVNDELIDYLPEGFSTDKIYLRSYFEEAGSEEREQKITEATEDIISSMNKGIMISNYIGHGVMDRWSGSKGLFKPENVQSLKNKEQLIFALMMTCINGYFADQNKYSLAEEFLLAPGGAVGAFAPSNVSFLWEDMILGNEVFSNIFEQGNRILGSITTQAKIAAYQRGTSSNVIEMFTLFGDPAVSLKNWQ